MKEQARNTLVCIGIISLFRRLPYRPSARNNATGTLDEATSEPSGRRKRYVVFLPGADATSTRDTAFGPVWCRSVAMSVGSNVAKTKRYVTALRVRPEM